MEKPQWQLYLLSGRHETKVLLRRPGDRLLLSWHNAWLGSLGWDCVGRDRGEAVHILCSHLRAENLGMPFDACSCGIRVRDRDFR